MYLQSRVSDLVTCSKLQRILLFSCFSNINTKVSSNDEMMKMSVLRIVNPQFYIYHLCSRERINIHSRFILSTYTGFFTQSKLMPHQKVTMQPQIYRRLVDIIHFIENRISLFLVYLRTFVDVVYLNTTTTFYMQIRVSKICHHMK